MQHTRTDSDSTYPAPARPAAQEPVVGDFSDSEGGLFAGPASLLPEMESTSDEPPVRSLFSPRGLFRV